MVTRRCFLRYFRFSVFFILIYTGLCFIFFKTSLLYQDENIDLDGPEMHHWLVAPYPYPYEFLMNPHEKCQGRTPFLVLLVVAESHDVDSRMTIRETWGNESNYGEVDVVTVFLVGLSPNETSNVQKMLEEENSIYGDIVQQDFMDTYYNLTIKILMGMEWIAKYCSNTGYVMKIDSDMFLNVDYLVHKVLHPSKPICADYSTGLIVENTKPIRDKTSKWYVSKKIYPNDTYPPYFSGPGYVFSAELAQRIYNVAQVISIIPFEDCFFGICLYHLKIQPYAPPTDAFNGHWIDYDRCQYNKLATVHHYTNDKLREVWKDFWSLKKSGCPDDGIFDWIAIFLKGLLKLF
ncbi:hypothetical protein GDO86_006909 [Hymenochirus boettgeri]|uniref:Hexosyltransferase n=1 Tax=Hymenochirus boettgeri TaxID=247094 RepID=A0A8T2JFI7_9PIPI|nr:hypothetical protein GDO86_006909 [Hymenochirus boettgeri]